MRRGAPRCMGDSPETPPFFTREPSGSVLPAAAGGGPFVSSGFVFWICGLKQLWECVTVAQFNKALDNWCEMAYESNLKRLMDFADILNPTTSFT
ncbi:hypothetical protein HKBW3S25_00907 [Candidatus Hakubella thermalkaliphila]|uniref:Uncharacterized protein n=1 Tax=Candidatus Hakubella thermalkaliphila TaxID=2754717 RepID=A0A6V8NYT5_9ACTN|nr:hypothetical protein HKBW3S25_00907 [Candidatus Hakubella thermalkaliphila]